MQSFICFINSNICSGGKLATALLIASGAFSGSTGSPYGLCSWTGPAGATPKSKTQDTFHDGLAPYNV